MPFCCTVMWTLKKDIMLYRRSINSINSIASTFCSWINHIKSWINHFWHLGRNERWNEAPYLSTCFTIYCMQNTTIWSSIKSFFSWFFCFSKGWIGFYIPPIWLLIFTRISYFCRWFSYYYQLWMVNISHRFFSSFC